MNELPLQEIANRLNALSEIDPGVLEMLPAKAREVIESIPEMALTLGWTTGKLMKLENDFTDLNLALVEYANQSGQGQMMMDNLKLCLDQVRMQKANVSPSQAIFDRMAGQGRG